MKITGILMAVVGFLIVSYSAVLLNVGAASTGLIFALAFGLMATIGGAAMYLFGGRGYIEAPDPAIRN